MQSVKTSPRKLSLYDVARAVEDDRLALNFQPIVRSGDDRFVLFHEGLIRLFDDDGHLRVAGEFMDLVDGTEVANYVDQVALELALARLRVDPAIRVSINMSPRTMWDEDWMYLLDMAGQRDRSVTERLIVEFTETAVMGVPSQALKFMEYCRKYGVNFAVDDFGAGQTVLGSLRRFRFDVLKIDGSIAQDVGTNRDSQVLVRAILYIAKHFEMTTIAEFIDNEASARVCKEMGVDGLQGFLFGRGDIFNLDQPNLVARARQKLQ